MKLFISMVASALLVSGAAYANDQEWTQSTIFLTTAIDIDSTGTIVHMDPLPNKDNDGNVVPASLRDLAQSAITKWQFMPALANGVPAPAHTFVWGVFEFRPHGKNYDGRFVPIGNGPRIVRKAGPVYPDAMRASNIQAKVTMLALVEPDGRLSEFKLESAKTTNKRAATDFVQSAKLAMHSWRAEPETVDGHGVRTWVRVPVQYMLSRSTTDQQVALDLQRSVDSPTPQHDSDADVDGLAVDSPIKLRPQSP